MATDDRSNIRVKAQFQRSVRLDADIDRRDALIGYVIQTSPWNALETVARHVRETQQRAFTWTGPYGGGKSSLALALAQLAGGTVDVRRSAKDALHVEDESDVARVFCGDKPWLVLPVVGRRESIVEAITAVIDRRSPEKKRSRGGRRDVINELIRRAESPETAGVLVVLDELGKLLESAAAAQEDIHLLQELAEAASRCSGQLVVIGILHQAFEQYAARLGREVRDEWAKIQGRFVDIPIIAGTDEVIDLIGRALESDEHHPWSRHVSESIANVIRYRRPSSPASLATSLDRCWPLHPVTAALLGPSSRRRFGQNERSVFGFLTSAEPLGFREFLQGFDRGSSTYYYPARFWDYLKTNLEPAILSSPDGHRWAVSAEAVERVESRFAEPHVSIVKTVGLIELFRNGSGLAAESAVLFECAEDRTSSQVESALSDLTRASILIYRKHLRAWGIFAGSDFDIDAAVDEARAGLGRASELNWKDLISLPPITARRHYSETGSLRWFDRLVVPASRIQAIKPPRGTSKTGTFVLIVPDGDVSESMALDLASKLSENPDNLDLYGVSKRHLNVLEKAFELAALELVARNKPELEGDSVALREIEARLRQLRVDMEAQLRDAFVDAHWHFRGRGHSVDQRTGLSPLASFVCDIVYPDAPYIHSELVNRDSLSSSAAKAQRALMHRMLQYSNQPNLDYEGYPADAGLYFTVLAELGIHRESGDGWHFTDLKGLAPGVDRLWERTRQILNQTTGPITLADVYTDWRAPPFGLKKGVLPILALAFLLAHRSRIVVYVEGTFVAELTEAGVDEWLQDPNRISWKSVQIDAAAEDLLIALSRRLEGIVQRPVLPDPLDSARALVSFTLSLPQWTQRTSQLSERARALRTLLLRASDPVKVIFADLPELLGTRDPEHIVQAVGDIVGELAEAYPSELRKILDRFFRAIDHNDDLDSLRSRAKFAQGTSGDFKIDALTSRLSTFNGSMQEIEGLVSLAVSKPPTGFTDQDFSHAALQLTKWAFEFRRVEAAASVQGRVATRQALAVVFGGGRTVSGTFDVSDSDSSAIKVLADSMLGSLIAGKVTSDIFLAALVEAGSRVLEQQQKENAHE